MKFIILAMLIAFPYAASASIQNISANDGAVEFTAVGKPSFIKIHGTGNAASGQVALDDGKVTGKFKFDLASLGTGIETRDEHMKTKYLEVAKFPSAELELESAGPIPGWTISHPQVGDLPFSGKLTLHGMTKSVAGTFHISGSGSAEVQFKLNLTDFAVAIPSFAGITVADEVQIVVNINKLKSI